VRLATDHPDRDLQDVTATAIEAVAATHADTCDLDHPGTPSSSITLLRTGEETVDYLVVHDSVVVLDRLVLLLDVLVQHADRRTFDRAGEVGA
jgi:hypothetical protein